MDSHSDHTDITIHQEWNIANTTESLWYLSPKSYTQVPGLCNEVDSDGELFEDGKHRQRRSI